MSWRRASRNFKHSCTPGVARGERRAGQAQQDGGWEALQGRRGSSDAGRQRPRCARRACTPQARRGRWRVVRRAPEGARPQTPPHKVRYTSSPSKTAAGGCKGRSPVPQALSRAWGLFWCLALGRESGETGAGPWPPPVRG